MQFTNRAPHLMDDEECLRYLNKGALQLFSDPSQRSIMAKGTSTMTTVQFGASKRHQVTGYRATCRSFDGSLKQQFEFFLYRPGVHYSAQAMLVVTVDELLKASTEENPPPIL